jgi:hypothetical protein
MANPHPAPKRAAYEITWKTGVEVPIRSSKKRLVAEIVKLARASGLYLPDLEMSLPAPIAEATRLNIMGVVMMPDFVALTPITVWAKSGTYTMPQNMTAFPKNMAAMETIKTGFRKRLPGRSGTSAFGSTMDNRMNMSAEKKMSAAI